MQRAEFGHFAIEGMEFRGEETIYANAQELRREQLSHMRNSLSFRAALLQF